MKSKFFRIFGVVTTVAVLVSMLSIAPAIAVSAVTVTIATGQNVISMISADYTISFALGTQLVEGAVDDTITITFPTGTIVAAAPTVVVAASPGWWDDPTTPATDPVWTTAVISTPGVVGDPTTRTIKITLNDVGDKIGSTASVFVSITDGVTNPPTAGDYTLTVATSKETTAVASNTYAIIVPTLEFPGIVKVFNSSGIQITQTSGAQPITDAITLLAGGAAGYTLEVGPGYYNEPGVLTLTDLAGEYDKLIIKALGSVAETIVTADWSIEADEVSFKGLTMRQKAGVGADTVITVVGGALSNGNKVTIDGCTFVRSSATAVSETFIEYNNQTTLALGGAGTITNCTFDSQLGSVQDLQLIKVGAGVLVAPTISKNTFKLDPSAAGASDWAIRTASPVTVSENTFTGSSGFGKGVIVDAGGNATIDKNTFTGLITALEMTTATSIATFKNNTVTDNGLASATTPVAAIKVTDNGGLNIFNNKITGSKYYIAEVLAGDLFVDIHFNSLTGNTKGIKSAAVLAAQNNWWGAATGPAADFNTALVDATPFLGAEASNGVIALGAAVLDAKATTGVIVNLLKAGVGAAGLTNADVIGVASYAANPGAAAPSSTLKIVKYFDAYVLDGDADNDFDTARIIFYGAVNAFSEVWVYSPFAGTWVKCSHQSVNTTSGFIAVDVDAVSTPSLLDMYATPFVIVEAPPAAPGGAVIPQSPALGSVNVPIDTTFTWPAVAGAVSYEFEIAEEIGQADKFYLKDEVGSSTVNAFKLVDTLKYDTQYWWRVRAVNSLGVKSAYTTSFFTTEKEPVVVEPTPPVVIETTPPPQITLEIPPAQVTRVEPIPAYLLWAVIAVGAILVIAVIVLIVRTRRIS